jgi:hypothetical protein
MPPAQFPFTKRCADAGIVTLEPDDAWFNERCIDAPSGRAARLEVFASHAWAYGSCDLDDDEAVLGAWGTLSKKERDYLLGKCQHPMARAGDGVMTSAVRFLKDVRSPSSRKSSAAGGTPIPSDAASVRTTTSTFGGPVDGPSPPKAPRVYPHLSPASNFARLAAGCGGAASFSVLHAELNITYGQAADRLGPDLLGLFDITGLADWSKADRSDFRSKSRDVAINSNTAKEHGWQSKPSLSILENLMQAPPAGSEEEDESARLGARLARVARYKTSKGDCRAYRSADKVALAQDLAVWRDYCSVIVRSPLAAASRVEALLNIVRGHFLDRTDALRAVLTDRDLAAFIPCIEQQFVDLCELLHHQQARVHAAMAGSEEDRATTSNTEWMEFLKPFFNGVLGASVTRTTAERAAAALAAASAVAVGAAPPPTAAPATPAPAAPPSTTHQPAASHTTAPYPVGPPPYQPPAPTPYTPPGGAGASFGAAPAASGAAAAPGGKPRRPEPTFIPASAEIVGPRLAVQAIPPSRAICRTCPGCSHAHSECPIRYFAHFGAPCPGFDPTGARVPGDWVNGDLTPAACAAWKVYIAVHGLRKHTGVRAVPAF